MLTIAREVLSPNEFLALDIALSARSLTARERAQALLISNQVARVQLGVLALRFAGGEPAANAFKPVATQVAQLSPSCAYRLAAVAFVAAYAAL